jgi:hypothetical protein
MTSKSPERYTFQVEGAKRRAEEKGEEVPEHYLEFWKTAKEQDEANLVNPDWQHNNLEYDLRSTKWILAKARASENYAQNVYAALCNMRWQRLDTFPILKDEYWSCSWRSAGGIVADMLEKGDYIDWYCSGIGNSDDGYGLSHKQADGYVSEGEITDEILADFKALGWTPSEWPEDKD